MDGFIGFPGGKVRLIPVPELFFSELLPSIDDLCELKVTLHCLWLLHCKRGDVRYVTTAELCEDELLMRGLGACVQGGLPRGRTTGQTDDARRALREGLERAVARGTLLQVTAHHPGRAPGTEETLYFLNSERGRAAVERIARGEWAPEALGEPVHLEARRPNIFNLYERNLGLIASSLLAEELIEAERSYPMDWIEDAIRIAVTNNVRRWTYVRRILERWEAEGRDRDRGGRRGPKGEYDDIVKR